MKQKQHCGVYVGKSIPILPEKRSFPAASVNMELARTYTLMYYKFKLKSEEIIKRQKAKLAARELSAQKSEQTAAREQPIQQQTNKVVSFEGKEFLVEIIGAKVVGVLGLVVRGGKDADSTKLCDLAKPENGEMDYLFYNANGSPGKSYVYKPLSDALEARLIEKMNSKTWGN
jgi:hypothetical protein